MEQRLVRRLHLVGCVGTVHQAAETPLFSDAYRLMAGRWLLTP